MDIVDKFKSSKQLGRELLNQVSHYPNVSNERIIALIEHGADLNMCDKYLSTPLMKAILRGQNEIATLLINKGADLDTRDYLGNTALILAVRFSQTETALALIKKGAALDVRGHEGNTALILATYKDLHVVRQALIDKGANPAIKNMNAQSAQGDMTSEETMHESCPGTRRLRKPNRPAPRK